MCEINEFMRVYEFIIAINILEIISAEIFNQDQFYVQLIIRTSS